MFKIKEIRPNIFLMDFENGDDLAMHFLRYQEYYESASPKYRGHAFELLDFMRWYANKYGGGCFTYTTDWGGFNIPGEIIFEVNEKGIPDPNKYDETMANIYKECHSKAEKFYLIGTVGEDSSVVQHEIAHGFFYTKPEYKKEMEALVKELPNDVRHSVADVLKEMGYAPGVIVDEIQAYLSTGILPKMRDAKSYRKPFVKTFERYYNLGLQLRVSKQTSLKR